MNNGRRSRKSSTHKENSIKIDNQKQDFDEFDDEIEAIMSGKGSKGSIGNNSKDSLGKKGIGKRSNTVHVSNSSKSSHKSSKFFKSKKSFKELPQSIAPTQYKTGMVSESQTGYDIYSPQTQSLNSKNGVIKQMSRGYMRGNTSLYYEVDGIKEVPEDEEKRSDPSSNSHMTPSIADLNYTLSSATQIEYRRDMDEHFGRSRHLRVPVFF